MVRSFAIARGLTALVISCLFFTCSDGEAPSAAPRSKGGATKQATTKSGAKPKMQQAGFANEAAEQGASSATSTASMGPTGLLELVPSDAWLVLRWPTLRSATDAWKASEIVQALERAGLHEAALAVVDPLESARQAAREFAPPDAMQWVDAIAKLRGDALVALLSVDPMTMSPAGEPATRVLALVSLGDAEQEIVKLLELATKLAPRGTNCERLAAGHYRIVDDAGDGELRVRDGRFEFLFGIGCDPGRLDEVLAADAARSFATCASYTSAPKPAGIPWLELHANAAPMLALFDARAPAEAREVAQALGFDALAGIHASFALDGGLMRNTFAVQSRGRGDIVSACFSDRALDRGFARLVPEDAETAMLFALDLSSAATAVRSHLPTRAKPDFDAALAEFENATGLDPDDALLSNFGPNVVLTSRGSVMSAMTGSDEYEAAIAIQVRNQSAAEALFGMLLETNKAVAKPRTKGDLRYVSIGMPIPELAWLDFSVGITDGLLVMATSGAALEQVFERAKDSKQEDVRCAALAAALGTTPADAFFVSTSDTSAEIQGVLGMMNMGSMGGMPAASTLPFELPTAEQVAEFCRGLGPSVTTIRATQDGLVYESVGPVNMPWSGAPSLAIIASIAIPKLLAARSSANEAAAIATLRNLSSAQAQFQAVGVKDRDGDGIGEYGSFGELTGKIALANGTRLNPPLMSSRFANVDDGVVQRSGYIFSVILPGPNAQPLPETGDGGAGPSVDPELAELYFTAYAWPVSFGQTGGRMFAIDQGGTIYAAHPASFDPPCSGMDSPPPLMDVFDFDARYAAARMGTVDDCVWEPVN